MYLLLKKSAHADFHKVYDSSFSSHLSIDQDCFASLASQNPFRQAPPPGWIAEMGSRNSVAPADDLTPHKLQRNHFESARKPGSTLSVRILSRAFSNKQKSAVPEGRAPNLCPRRNFRVSRVPAELPRVAQRGEGANPDCAEKLWQRIRNRSREFGDMRFPC
jgi:hypothetical protein